MKNVELKQMRDEALYNVYLESLSHGSFTSLNELAEYSRKQPAPQFFIDSRTISLTIGMIEQRISLINLNEMSRRKAWQLYDNYVQWKKENPDSTLSRERICEILVDEPAPEFYVHADTARKIIQRVMKQRREQIKNNY